MKKAIGIVLTLCLMVALSFALGGCGASVDKTLYTGNWVLVSASSDDLDEATLQLMSELGLQVTMTLNEDGTGTMDVVDVKSNLTWEAKSNTEATGTMDAAAITYTLADGKLTLHDESNVTMTFAREGSDEANARQAVSSASSQSASSASAASEGASASTESASADAADTAGGESTDAEPSSEAAASTDEVLEQ